MINCLVKGVPAQGCRFGHESKPNPGNQYSDPQVPSVALFPDTYRGQISDQNLPKMEHAVQHKVSTYQFPRFGVKIKDT